VTAAAPGRRPETAGKVPDTERDKMQRWECVVCGFIYDEALGLPDEGIAPGTRWQDIPEDWECPECGVAKSDFDMVVI